MPDPWISTSLLDGLFWLLLPGVLLLGLIEQLWRKKR